MFFVAVLSGCAASVPEPKVRDGEPVGLQMVRTEAQLAKAPFFTLLSFETDADPVFVKTEGAEAQADATRRHTGQGSLRLAPGTKSAVVKLASLHSGREWPGRWTLIGAYCYSTRPQVLSAAFEADGKTLEQYTVQIPANQWTPVVLDILSALSKGSASTIGTLRFTFPDALPDGLWLDDVVEIDNTGTLYDGPGDGLSIREKGFAFTVERAGKFRQTFRTPEADPAGWKIEETNAIRVRLSSRGPQRSMLIYPDGRQIIDGVLQPILGNPPDTAALAASHNTPARITVTGDAGRLDRNSPGDANNDGYAEQSGTYQLIADGPRLELRIEPQGVAVVRPVLEVRELPRGSTLVTMEGVLVERIVRLDSGNVLIELPGILTRPTLVNIRVGQ
ncbi:MAG: hypothetical protein ACHRHE_20420 [Tepidisphaerales bacterium]